VGSVSAEPAPVPGQKLIARMVTDVAAPANVVAVLLVVMSIHVAPPADALRWAVVSILFASVLPMTYVVAQVRRRRLTDRHVGLRVQRPLPMLVAISSTVVGLLVLYALNAPRPLLALAAAGIAGLCVTALITLFWKISLHAAVIAGALTIVVIVFGFAWLPLFALLLLVGWARVDLGDHTIAEVGAGGVVGSLIAATVFLLLA
jgi:hypothetical protein